MKMKHYEFFQVIPYVYVSNTERQLFNQPDEPTEYYLDSLLDDCPELAGVRIIDMFPPDIDPEEAEYCQPHQYIFFEADELLFIVRMIRLYNRVAHLMGDNGEDFCQWADWHRVKTTSKKELEEFEKFLYTNLKSGDWKKEYEAFQQSLIEDEDEEEFYDSFKVY